MNNIRRVRRQQRDRTASVNETSVLPSTVNALRNPPRGTEFFRRVLWRGRASSERTSVRANEEQAESKRRASEKRAEYNGSNGDNVILRAEDFCLREFEPLQSLHGMVISTRHEVSAISVILPIRIDIRRVGLASDLPRTRFGLAPAMSTASPMNYDVRASNLDAG